VDVNERGKNGQTALMAAAHRGNKEMVTLLLEKDADPNVHNDKGDSALSLAVIRAHEAVAMLLATKSSVATRNRVDPQTGRTILMDAAQHGMAALTQLLVQKGAKADAKTESGQSALSLALAANHSEVAAVLVDTLGPYAAIEAAAAAVVQKNEEDEAKDPEGEGAAETVEEDAFHSQDAAQINL
jgi:ankyrin repeat protein